MVSMAAIRETTQMRLSGAHRRRGTRPRRTLKLAVAAFTLLALPSGTCVDMTVRVAINSFFDGATPALDDQLTECLTEAWSPDQVP
jgi:hypothetical protein